MPILIVDGQQKLAEIVTQSLRREGLLVDVAATLQGGSRLATSGGYDLIILDMELPDGLGITLLKQLRDLGNEVPVLILSALSDLKAKTQGFTAGADDYVCKPFELTELSLRVKALLRRSPTLRGHIIKLADLQIDRMNRHVRRGGGLIRLSPKEFSLLEHLAVNHGQILSRAIIVDRVWGKAFKGKKNIVDVYVRQLRLKIDENFEPKLIQTARGKGYSIGIEALL
jgi:two-component system copper resistance phosphate regulon response regulator CusR